MTRNFSVALALAAIACGGGEPPKPAEPPKAAEAPKAPEPAPAPPAAPPAPAATATADAGAANGEAIYKQYCTPCHGVDGKGNNGMAASYVDDPARLAKPDEELIASIKNGKTGTVGTMPPWGGVLNDDQIKAVLGYIRTTFGKK
jgi:mono/diheme cytochrome c family protein